ncbi:MAG: P1 family peptidase [Firmicutes bacterium]|nr:P1 family peptidase [Bacillota bacterium]
MKEISINQVEGFYIGNAQNTEGGTGCTAIYCPEGAVAGVDVRGGGPATRETDLLDPVNMVEKIHCVMLSGGSAYGLAAAGGAMDYLEEHGIGFDVGVDIVPIVPSACLFDLAVGDSKCRPDHHMGYLALVDAEKNDPQQGIVGAGTGATVGKLCGAERAMKSGLGLYAEQYGDLKVGAVVAVNALGDVIDPDTNLPVAGLLNEEKNALSSTSETIKNITELSFSMFKGNTTLGCIITNAKLTKAQAKKVAMMAHNGYARAIRPVHTSADGDTIFTMATGTVEAQIDAVGVIAAEVMAKAIARAVKVPSAYGLIGSMDL